MTMEHDQNQLESITLPSDKVFHGIDNFLDDYVKVKQTDKVIVCFWHRCAPVVSWLLLILEERQQQHAILSFAHRDPKKFQHDLDSLIENGKDRTDKQNKTVILVCEEESLSFSPYLRQLNQTPNMAVWRMMNTSAHLFEEAFAVPTNTLKNINAWLLSKLMKETHVKLRIKNDLGTDLEVILNNSKYQWISTYGVPGEKELILLPSGEINTFPDQISGTFVAYGALHSNIELPFDTRLEKKPITLKISSGVLQSFSCPDPSLTKFLNDLFKEPHMIIVGEFGIGTNIGITYFTANNSHINERFPGVHLGLGSHFQREKISYQTPIHMDFISPYGEIYINDDPTPICLNQLQPIETTHPENLSAEDGE